MFDNNVKNIQQFFVNTTILTILFALFIKNVFEL